MIVDPASARVLEVEREESFEDQGGGPHCRIVEDRNLKEHPESRRKKAQGPYSRGKIERERLATLIRN